MEITLVGLGAVIWSYILARMVTRGVLRSLKEAKNGEEEARARGK
jgi:hypothetical protein